MLRSPPFPKVHENDDETCDREYPRQYHATDVPEEPRIKAADFLVDPNLFEISADDNSDRCESDPRDNLKC